MPNQSLFDRPMIEARDIHFGFSKRMIFQGLDLIIPRGKVTAIMGPSGCGKSTFLSLVGGRLIPQSGELLFDGQQVPRSNNPTL